jgi:hypothetical protein
MADENRILAGPLSEQDVVVRQVHAYRSVRTGAPPVGIRVLGGTVPRWDSLMVSLPPGRRLPDSSPKPHAGGAGPPCGC